MKVLLLGDYSSFHYNLSLGLRKLGIDVTLASAGDGWKNTPRDIDLKQPENFKHIGFTYKLIKNYTQLINYDVVQFITANFLITSPFLSSLYFDLLKPNNGKLFICATGMDYHYVSYALTGKLKHSVFYTPEIQDDPYIEEIRKLSQNTKLKLLEEKIISQCNGIIATSNGYHSAYKHYFPEKSTLIPLPIDTSKYPYISTITQRPKKINIFLGLMKNRMKIKGTNRIQNALLNLKRKYPNDVNLTFVDSVPLDEYTQLLNNSHILCDQLYASGIGMNALIALSKGLIVGGCGDDDLYDSLGEKRIKPLLDLNKSDNEILLTFENVLENKGQLKEQSLLSREFVVKHHDCIKVAQQYLNFWQSK